MGLHSDQRADMAAAIAQAPLLKRGHEFQTVSEHLQRKTSVGQVQMAKPFEMISTGADKVQNEDNIEEAQLFGDGVPWVGAEVVVGEQNCSSLTHSQEGNFGEVEEAQDSDIEKRNDRWV